MKSPILALSLTLSVPLLLAGGAQALPQAFGTPLPAGTTARAGTADRGQETEAQMALEATRLLYLDSGRVLRGRTRWAEDRWELRRGQEWISLEPGSVERFVKERTLLQDARKRERAIAPGDFDTRAEHARWLQEQGLHAEALGQLESVLDHAPDHALALRLLDQGPTLATLPAVDPAAGPAGEALAREELLRYGAKGGAVARELTIRELSKLEDTASLEEDLRAELSSHSIRRRAFAAHCLGRLFGGSELRHLLMRTVLDSCADVRKSCAFALKGTGDAAIALPLLRSLGSAHVEVRTNAAEALGMMGFPETIEPLVRHYATLSSTAQGGSVPPVPRGYIFVGKQFAFVQDFDVEVAQFQAVADPQVNVMVEGSVLEGSVVSVRNSQLVHERSTVRGALRRLTGADPGDRPSDWVDWWSANRARYGSGDGRTTTGR